MKAQYQRVMGGRLKFTLTLQSAEFHLLLVAGTIHISQLFFLPWSLMSPW